MARANRSQKNRPGYPRFWGRHAVIAALDNPARTIRRLWGARDTLAEFVLPEGVPVTYAEAADLARLVPADAPHQGIVIEVEPLEDIWLSDMLAEGEGNKRPILVLDQLTDPHNVGAIFRSAAAFNALGIVTQDRHAPTESGTMAKAASGALEIVPWARVVNLARALDEIAEAGYWRIGLDGEAQSLLGEVVGDSRVALVMGAEGEGMRQNTAAHCDILARLPIHPQMESLNVSNAAAIALYETARG